MRCARSGGCAIRWSRLPQAINVASSLITRGQGFQPYIAEQEEMLFCRGYDHAEHDQLALAYYRYERGITDVAVDAGRILNPTHGQPDRAQSFEYLGYYFLPGCTLEMAQKSDNLR